MINERINNSINDLATNFFLNKDTNDKLYVCHYIFCSYVLTKNEQLFKFALDILKETIKYSYLNKKRKIHDFYRTINYCISISASMNIELDIDELIEGVSKKQILLVSMFYDKELLFLNNDSTNHLSNKKHLPLKILLLIRNNKIDKNNHFKYIQILYQRYSLENNKDFLICISIISYFFKNKKALFAALNQLTQCKLSNHNKQFIDLIKGGHKNDLLNINRDISSVLMLINDTLKVDLSLIYYSLMNEKTEYYFS